MAALTSELDTQVVTTRVKELLLANNLGQKVKTFKKINNTFVEIVLNVHTIVRIKNDLQYSIPIKTLEKMQVCFSQLLS